MIFLGVDPGKSGAIAVFYGDGTIHTSLWSESDYRDLAQICCETDKCFCIVEKVHSMPKQGVSSSFNFGANFGWIQGLMYALDIPVQLVDPRKWKAYYGLDNDKQKSIACCKRLFPSVNLKATERCKKDHDGIAEAILMAEYGRRIYNEKNNQ